MNATQATIYRIEALNEAIRVEATKGNKAHTWLTQAEVKQLMDSCDASTLQGQRDKIVLGLLVGAGLRREELTNLTFDAALEQPVAGRSRRVLHVMDRITRNGPFVTNSATKWRYKISD